MENLPWDIILGLSIVLAGTGYVLVYILYLAMTGK